MPRRHRPARGESEENEPEVELVVAGRAWVRGRLQPIEVGIDGSGTIVRIARTVPGTERADFGDSVLLPSATDLHVHCREPGPDPVETLYDATVQAALGGVGLIGEMPNTQPPIDSPERLSDQVERVRGRAAVDVLVYALAAPGGAIGPMSRLAGAFKLFLSPTTSVEATPSPAALPQLLREVASTGLALSVHAEAPERFDLSITPEDLEEWNSVRPPVAEEVAIARLLEAADPALRLHIAHVTTPGGVERLRAAGHSFEATPQHLLLAAAHVPDAFRKVNPPLRDPAMQGAMLKAFDEGRVPILASDHAPHSAAAKTLPFPRAPSGAPGVETMLPLMLERVRVGDLGLPVLLAAACDRPARWAGRPIGRIAVGHRADLVVVDFRRHRALRARELHAACGWTPFEGRTAVFPTHHLRAGRVIVEDGEFVGTPMGRPVRPEFALAPRPPAAPPEGPSSRSGRS